MARPVTLSLVTTACQKAYGCKCAVSTGQTDLRAGVKLSTALFILFFDDSIFADVNRILCANHNLPDVKSVINLSFKRTSYIF